MKNGMVIKHADDSPHEDEMALVNRYARRELSEDEVYLFTVALCDNDIDRDYERFTPASLEELARLFVGKTGITDHQPFAKNQKARILSCRVEAVEGAYTAGLTARAYIRRTQGNAELIEAIDSGIVKEVSVGCSIGRTVCSVCGRELRECGHVKGERYDGRRCWGELCDPTDAYEFSFVAVPAQRAAGVIKSVTKEKTMEEIRKTLESESELVLGTKELKQLRNYIASLEQDAEGVRLYRGELICRLNDGLRAKGVAIASDTAKSIADKLSVGELCALIDAVGGTDGAAAVPQLAVNGAPLPAANTQFRI